MTRDEFEKQIILKAVKDAAFREQLTKDPKGTLERELQQHKEGITLPANLKVSVVQETPDHIYLRLPVMPAGTMSEQELVGMSGGAGTGPTAITTTAVQIDITAAISIDVTAVTTAVTTVVGIMSNEVQQVATVI